MNMSLYQTLPIAILLNVMSGKCQEYLYFLTLYVVDQHV